MAGPFSFETFTNKRILELCSANAIPSQLTEFMQLYYAALPVFTDEQCIYGIRINKAVKLITLIIKYFIIKYGFS
jgi:two-component system, response regulator YesN